MHQEGVRRRLSNAVVGHCVCVRFASCTVHLCVASIVPTQHGIQRNTLHLILAIQPHTSTTTTATRDERELFVIRNHENLNQMDEYEMVSDAPRVEITYEKKKQYCASYKVSFYVERSVSPSEF